MQKRLIPTIILIVYTAILVRLLLFKIGLIKIGHMRFKLTDHGKGANNFMPFKTIWMYLHWKNGWLIPTLNLVGNIALFVPLGFLTPFVYRNMNWLKSLALGIVFSLTIEVIQFAWHVGIADVDDVILNALGVMIGYWVFSIFAKRGMPRLQSPKERLAAKK